MSYIPARRRFAASLLGVVSLAILPLPVVLLSASLWAMDGVHRDSAALIALVGATHEPGARERRAEILSLSTERGLHRLLVLQLAAFGLAVLSSGCLLLVSRSLSRQRPETASREPLGAAEPFAEPATPSEDLAASRGSFSMAVEKLRKFFDTDRESIEVRLRAVTSMNTAMAGGEPEVGARVPGVMGSVPPSGSFPTEEPASRCVRSPGASERQVKRVLLVDDDAEVLRAFSRVLRAQGYEVTSAASARQAMDELKSGDFDVIVSDITMPEMDGIQLLREVRDRDLMVPVVLVTGVPAVGTAAQAVELGAFQYLVKPVDKESLRKVVDHAARVHDVARARQQAAELLGQEGNLGTDRAGLEGSFGRALDGLWMAYQPIVDVRRRTIFGYEALLRSNEPALPHPGAVLDAAERLGRLDALGRVVRSRAAVPMMDAPAGPLLFVNLHVRDLLDPSLSDPDMPLSRIAERVVLEITERSSLEEVRDARGRAAALREMGFRIAVDDMGAGYAGLSSFALLEPEIVKLDMSLIRDVHITPTKQKVIRSMTSLAKDMGIQIIGEGIETAAERDTLIELGCELHQGYFFARPGKPFPAVSWPAHSVAAEACG